MFLAFLGWYWEGSSSGPTPPDPPSGGAVPAGGWDYGWVPSPRRLVAERVAMRAPQVADTANLARLILEREAEMEAARLKRNKAVAALLLAAV